MRRTPMNGGWETRPNANFFAEMVGAAAPWRAVTLPHDAALGRDRDASHGAGAGYVPGGVYEYRTTLAAPEEYRDQRVLLEFEGVYRSAMVYVNGALAGQWATGYTAFTVDLDDHLLLSAPTTRSASSAGPTRTPAGTPAPASTGRCTSSSAR